LPTDALGQRICYGYDVLGRVTTKVVRANASCVAIAGSSTTTFTYDQVETEFYNRGRLTTAANEVATTEIDWDVGGRRAKEVWTVAGLSDPQQFRTSHFPMGQVRFRTWPDGTTTGSDLAQWEYDDAGRLKVIPDLIDDIAYSPRGQETEVDYASGARTVSS